MTKRERKERFNELVTSYSVRSMADVVIQLEEHCEKKGREMSKLAALRARVMKLEAALREIADGLVCHPTCTAYLTALHVLGVGTVSPKKVE